jgi:hypothetical protein
MSEEDEEERNGGHGFFWFVTGILVGVAAAIFVPRWVAPYLPSFLGGGAGVEGEVVEKVSEPDRILVKVATADGLVLATFTQNLKELDLLIGQGDSITLGLDGYEPLVENPEVARVIGSATSGEPARLPPPRLEEPEGELEPVGQEETLDSSGEDVEDAEEPEEAETELEDEEDETNETRDRVP